MTALVAWVRRLIATIDAADGASVLWDPTDAVIADAIVVVGLPPIADPTESERAYRKERGWE